MSVLVTSHFGAVGEGFELEYAGQFIRIWHDACLNHVLLPGDDEATVESWKAAHRCGERSSPWDRGDFGVRS